MATFVIVITSDLTRESDPSKHHRSASDTQSGGDGALANDTIKSYKADSARSKLIRHVRTRAQSCPLLSFYAWLKNRLATEGYLVAETQTNQYHRSYPLRERGTLLARSKTERARALCTAV